MFVYWKQGRSGKLMGVSDQGEWLVATEIGPAYNMKPRRRRLRSRPEGLWPPKAARRTGAGGQPFHWGLRSEAHPSALTSTASRHLITLAVINVTRYGFS